MGAISKDEVLAQLQLAIAAVSGEELVVEIEYSQTVQASLQLPGGENVTLHSPEWLQLRVGIASAIGSDVTVHDILLINGRRRRMQEPPTKRLVGGFHAVEDVGHRRQAQMSTTVQFRVTADSDLSQTLADESFISTLVEKVNDAGGDLNLDSDAVNFAEQPSYTTQVTYTIRRAISSTTNATEIGVLRSIIRSDQFSEQLMNQLAESHPGVVIASVTYPGMLCEGNPCKHGNCTESIPNLDSEQVVRQCDCEEGYILDNVHRTCRGTFDVSDVDADDKGPGVDWGYAFGALVLVLGLFCVTWMLKGQELRWMLFRPKPRFHQTPPHTLAHQSNEPIAGVARTQINAEYRTPTKLPSAAQGTSIHAGYGTQMDTGHSKPSQSYRSPSATAHWSTLQPATDRSTAAGRWQHDTRQISTQRQVTRVSRNVPRDLDAAAIARLV
jgi:hypothetical protein